jgi:predicted N-formylglutamate amidohydrolase
MATATSLSDSGERAVLTAGDPDPVGIENPQSDAPFLLICDHAGNAVPARLGDLGLAPEELNRHIAIDIGALSVARRLVTLLDAPLYYQRYSRLVVDSNRQLHAADSMPTLSDGTEVPGNRGLSPEEREARARAILAPYHDRIEEAIEHRLSRGRETILVSVHSFTPKLKARPTDRPWHVGVCWGEDDRFARHTLAALAAEHDLRVGANEPYSVDMVNDYSIPLHAERRRLPYVEFEIRQDLLSGEREAQEWADRLARVLRRARETFRAEGV